MDVRAFDDRYGKGAHDRLLELLGRPCETFAQIAVQFGVTRERVRQWHQQLLPSAPTGRARQQACVVYRQRRRLFLDPVFRAFFHHARSRFERGRIQFVQTRAGFSPRLVRIDERAVAIRPAPAGTVSRPPRYRGEAEFVFVPLAAGDFLFVPASLLRGQTQALRDDHLEFHNTFAALEPARLQSSA